MKSIAVGLALWASLVPCELLRSEDVVYVGQGAEWKLFRGLSEASSPDITAWRAADFDDGSWESAPAPFGYGEEGCATDLGTLDPEMRYNYTSIFLRRTFEVPSPDEVVKFEARVDYDDGFVIWINGVEVARDAVSDPITFDATASTTREPGNYESFDLPAPLGYIVAGTNTIAVQAFNQPISSRDFKIDVELVDPLGPDRSPPEVVRVVPRDGLTVRSLERVEVLFSEDVVGVDAGDLQINGFAAEGVSGAGKGPYWFTFPAPSPGDIVLEWASDSGIVDLAREPNRFSGQSWSCRLDPDAPLSDLVISELVASNQSGLVDEDREVSDWIEIWNRGTEVALLEGWSLTDDPDDLTQWVFPEVELAAGARLVVFASGKDRREPAGELHTSFRLSTSGEYLALASPDSPPEVVSEYAPRYPEQRGDIAYGLAPDGSVGHLDPPTPGEANRAATVFAGVTADPRFTPTRGLYADGIDVEIYCPTPEAAIYYTLDGSEPIPGQSVAYQEPIAVAGTPRKGVTAIRAVAVRDGFFPSRCVTHTYVFPEHVLTQPADPDGFPTTWPGRAADYAMDPRIIEQNRAGALDGLLSIPTLSLVMATDDFVGPSTGIYSHPSQEGLAWERPTSAELILPDGSRGFQINCGVRIQGGSSTSNWKSVKLSMRLLFKGDYGTKKLEYPFFPGSAVARFDSLVLDAHLNLTWTHPDHGQRVRSQYVRDAFVADLQNEMGSLGPHSRFVNLYVNGLYWGLYDAHERPDNAFAAEYLGGDKDEYDVLRHQSGVVVDGNGLAWSELLRRAASNVDLSDLTNYRALAEVLDVRDLADYMLANIYSGNDDWPHQNWYTARRRIDGAQWRFFSWDAEHVLKSVGINQTGVGTAANHLGSPAYYYLRLRASEEFRLLFADRVHKHFFGGCLWVDEGEPAWDPANPQLNRPAALYMERIREIDSAIRLESARWGDARPNDGRPGQPYQRDVEWLNELNSLLTAYFPQRSRTVLNQLRSANLYPRLDAPVFSHPGGTVQPGLALGMTVSEGTPYLTLDGSDPRVFGSGGVSPRATAYAAPIPIEDTVVVKARTFDAGTWSALAEATYVVSRPSDSLYLSEILYHAAEGSELDFLELHNGGDFTIDLSGLHFTNGIEYVFGDGRTLGPGEYLVLVEDYEAFTSRYPGVPVGGVYLGSLANGGEKITLRDATEATVLSVDYGDEGFWPIGPDGFGYSLVRVDAAADPDDAWSWRASSEAGGSPGAEDPEPVYGAVWIHELLTRSTAPLDDAIELYNPGDRAVDLGGWYLGDDRSSEDGLKKYRFPSGTVIQAGGYAAVYGADVGVPHEGLPGFHLSASGGGVYLSSADRAGNLTGWIVGPSVDGAEEGIPFGTVFTTTGPRLTALERPTFGVDSPATPEEFRDGRGAPNAGPRTGSVVIHEIQYHPLDGEEEFVELYNLEDRALDLTGWRLGGLLNPEGIDAFEFPTGSILPARGYLVVVGVVPEFFRSRYSVPDEATIVGPSGGALDNSGETVRLERPFDGDSDRPAFILVDRIRYNDRLPYALEADGEGPSLERFRAAEFGNDPVNWAASLEAGGTPGRPNSVVVGGVNQPPIASFTVIPQSESLNLVLDATASRDPDGALGRYEWSFGDGSTGLGETVLHAYPGVGSYGIRLTVTDGEGESSSTTRLVTLRGAEAGGLQLPGDANQDGQLNITDPISILGYLFLGDRETIGCGSGPLDEGGNRAVLDVDDSAQVNLTDAIYILNYLFLGGPAPAHGTECVHVPGCPDACIP